MLKTSRIRATAWILFFAIAVCYLALGPGTVEGRGYAPDDMQAGMGMLASFNAWVKGRPVPPLVWTRHGPIPLLFNLPFIKLGKLFTTPDFAGSVEPILATAALLMVVYLWLSKLCTPGMSLLITLIGAFGTMLWPYAYIGLEPKQSFFVLFAGYLGLANGKIRTWPRLILFSIAAGLAITMKSTGLVLAPAMAYLIYVQFRDDWRSRWKQALTPIFIVAAIWGLGALGWMLFWTEKGGGAYNLQTWMTDSTLQLFSNVVGIFGSQSKGVFIFAPVLLLCLYAVPRAFRTHRDVTIFALIVTLCMVALLAILFISADELWGPRFMHVAVAPLLIVIGAAWPSFRWRRHVPMLVLGALGFVISFLGAFYYYGVRGWAATAANQNTLEWFGGDIVWNEVQFDAKLFSVWLKGGTDPVFWTPRHVWAWTPPPDAQPWKTLNLRDYDDPQSYLLYYWKIPLEGSSLVIFRICLVSLLVGPVLLAWAIIRTIKMTAAANVIAAPIVTLEGRKVRSTS